MTVAVDDANNILQIGSVMKYEQPRKSPSFNVKGTVFIDNVSTAVTNYVAKVVFHSKSKLSSVWTAERASPLSGQRAGSSSLWTTVTCGVTLLCSGSEHRPFIYL